MFNRCLNGSQKGGVLVQGGGSLTLHFSFVFRGWEDYWVDSWEDIFFANNTPNYPFKASKSGFFARKHPFNYHLTQRAKDGAKPLFIGGCERFTGV